ncbi:MAG: hypothetical protein C0413_03145 [Clostridiales bacterium]|nr:hypothetical protein [Clostridiales bacterium]
MQYRIKTDPKRILGIRPNLSAQKSVADEIVTNFTSQQEQPTVPLSPIKPGNPSPWGKVFSIVGTALSFTPFVITAAAVIFSRLDWFFGVTMFLFGAIVYRMFSFIGGVILYLAARQINAFRKPVGWIALAHPTLALLVTLVSTSIQSHTDLYVRTSDGINIVAYVSLFIFLLCMIALCVFAVKLHIRAFKKPKKESIVEPS